MMRAALGHRVIGFPVGFWLATVAVVTLGFASALGLSDTVVFFLAVALTLAVALPLAFGESRR
jgi:hypothetical protein